MFNSHKSFIATWLFCCCFCILLMVGIGGITRVTKSGLSITEWKPIIGAIPPLTQNQWEQEFSKYQKIPEFKIINNQMNLDQFKSIFYIEYFHRLFGRITMIVCLLPLIYLYFKKIIYKKYFLKLLFIFSLIPIQGLIGWYMVKSGLTERVSVHEFWLAFHLCFALLIFGLILWQGLKIKYVENIRDDKITPEIFLFFLTFIITPLQIFFGGTVAGIHILNMCYQNSDKICSFKFLDVVQYQESIPFFWMHKLFAFILFFGIIISIFTKFKNNLKFSIPILFLLAIQIAFGVSILFINPQYQFVKYIAVAHQTFGFMIFRKLLYGFFIKRYNLFNS